MACGGLAWGGRVHAVEWITTFGDVADEVGEAGEEEGRREGALAGRGAGPTEDLRFLHPEPVTLFWWRGGSTRLALHMPSGDDAKDAERWTVPFYLGSLAPTGQM